jgi:uncharacterized membrane protein
MLIDSQKADAMQSALDDVFTHLPRHYQTNAMRLEMAKAIIDADDEGLCNYREAARAAVRAMFDSPENAVRNRGKLAPLAGSSAA